MQRVEDEVLALVGTRMTGDHLGPAGDYHLVDIAADQYLAVPEGGRHRVVRTAIAHQQLRTDPCPPSSRRRHRALAARRETPPDPEPAVRRSSRRDRAGDPRAGADNPRAAAHSAPSS